MNKIYRDAIEQIKLDGEDYSDEEMLPIYKEQKKELDRLYAIVGVLFIRYAIDGLLKMNASQKAGTGIKDILKTMGKKLGDSEVKKVTDILSTVYKDTYYKTIFTMESGMTINIKLPILKKEFVDAAVNAKYKGEFFSDRIWKNKSAMIDKLQAGLTDAMQGKTTIDKVARDIKNTFNVQAYESQRLVNTENARVQSQANDDIAHSIGVEQQMFSATLDNRTSQFCQDHDGKIYNIDDPDKPEIPVHPLCRSEFINVPYEGWSPTQRRDGETKELIPYQTYTEWKKGKGIN